MQFFKTAESRLALQTDKTTDEVVWQLVNNLTNHDPLKYFLPPPVLEVGTMRLSMAGDNWSIEGEGADAAGDTFDLYHAIADVTAAERGRFFFNRDGAPSFVNRHYMLRRVDPGYTLNDDMVDMVYTHAGQEILKNDVTVIC